MWNESIVEMVLIFLCRDGQVLLAEKKRTSGVGCLNGYGGRIEGGETFEQALIRECSEESGGQIKLDLQVVCYRGVIHFHNIKPGKGEIIFRVHMFVANGYSGPLPLETDEMGPPAWYPIDTLPFDCMMIGDREEDWVCRILRGEFVCGEIFYGPDQKVLSQPSDLWFLPQQPSV